MTTIRKLLLSLLFLVLPASSALAGGGGDDDDHKKQFTLTVTSSTSLPAPAYQFKFTNVYKSSFNSLTLSLPAGWTIASAGGATASRGTATLNGARNIVTVNNINLPTGSGQFMTVTVTGVTGNATTCASQTGTWAAQPWTGSTVGSGSKFDPKPYSGYPVSTTLPAPCFTIAASAGANGSITPSGSVKVASGANQSFAIAGITNYRVANVLVDGVSVGSPSTYTFTAVNANHTISATFAENTLSIATPSGPLVAGTPFPVSVGYDGPAPTSISLETTCTTSAAATQTVSNPATNPVVFSVSVPKAGSCTLKATATNYASKTLTTPLTVFTGTLACGGSSSSSPSVDVIQDWSYPQGSVLTSGGYSLIRGENKSGATCTSAVPYTFTLDTTGTQSASFIVPTTEVQKVAAQYVVVWAPVATTGGWYSAQPKLAWKSDTGGPIYMPGLPCTQDPTNFVSLTQAQLDTLMPAIPNAAPYNQEPLASAYGYSQGTTIVKARMCISQHGWTALGPVQSEDELGTKTLVQPWDKIIDLGDGYVSRDL